MRLVRRSLRCVIHSPGHDLNNLAIARPGLIEGVVNRGTAQVHQQFIDLTNPRQFDEVPVIE
jgi:hypothetical protein